MSHLDNFLKMLENQAEGYGYKKIDWKTEASFVCDQENLETPINMVLLTNKQVGFSFTVEGQFIGLFNYKE